MKKILYIAIAVLALSSCAVGGPVAVTSNSVGSKTGEASRKIWLGLAFGTTDVSITTAAKNGGITKIATVDHIQKRGLFSNTYTTIVTGE